MSSLQISTDDGITTVTLDRPEVHNALDEALIGELTEALERIDADADTRVVVLTGAGKSFCSGADLNWMLAMARFDEQANRADAMRLATLMRTLDGLSKPTIARVNGAAFGGAVGLVACCDIAIAVDLAKFSLSEVKLGLVPATIAPYVIGAIGTRNARRWMLSAETFDAPTAQRIGLVHEVVTVGALDGAVHSQCNALLQGGPQAQAAAKRLIDRFDPQRVDESIARETADLIAEIRVSAEGQEGLKAFLEKRKPAW